MPVSTRSASRSAASRQRRPYDDSPHPVPPARRQRTGEDGNEVADLSRVLEAEEGSQLSSSEVNSLVEPMQSSSNNFIREIFGESDEDIPIMRVNEAQIENEPPIVQPLTTTGRRSTPRNRRRRVRVRSVDRVTNRVGRADADLQARADDEFLDAAIAQVRQEAARIAENSVQPRIVTNAVINPQQAPIVEGEPRFITNPQEAPVLHGLHSPVPGIAAFGATSDQPAQPLVEEFSWDRIQRYVDQNLPNLLRTCLVNDLLENHIVPEQFTVPTHPVQPVGIVQHSRTNITDLFLPAALMPPGDINNQISFHGSFVHARYLRRGEMLLSFAAQYGTRLTWAEANIGSFYQVVEATERVTLLQRFWTGLEDACRDVSNDRAYVVNESLSKVFALNETGIRGLPQPNRPLEVDITPVPVSNCPSQSNYPFYASQATSLMDLVGTPSDETLAIFNLHGHNLRAIALLLGSAHERKLTDYALMAAQDRMGPNLQATRGFGTEWIRKLMAMHLTYPPGTSGFSGAARGSRWHISCTLAEGQEFRSVGGLVEAVNNLTQALTAIFSPTPEFEVTIFRVFFNKWQDQLTSRALISMKGWDTNFLRDCIVRSTIRLSLMVRDPSGAQMSQEDMIARLTPKIISPVSSLFNEFLQQQVAVLTRAVPRVQQYAPPPRFNRVARGGYVNHAHPVQAGGFQARRVVHQNAPRPMLELPPAPGWMAGGANHQGVGQGAPVAAAAGNRLCITHVLHLLGVGSRGPCSHPSCHFQHITIPSHCPPSLKTRLATLLIRDQALHALSAQALAALP